MKSIFMCLTVAFVASAPLLTFASNYNLNSYQGKNYEELGNACGLHVEVAGNNLVFTSIIPPHVDVSDKSCGGYEVCTGDTFYVECSSTTGKCINPDSGGVALILLNDGNIFFPFDKLNPGSTIAGSKFIDSGKPEHYVCINHW